MVRTSQAYHSGRNSKNVFLRQFSPRHSGSYVTSAISHGDVGSAMEQSPIDKTAIIDRMNKRSFIENIMRARRDTKELIERAALKLFVRNGVAATSIKDIAQEADVSQGAMYNHFASKDELAWLLFSDNFTEIGADLRQIAREDSDIKSKFRSITAYIFDRYDRDPLLISYCFLVRHKHMTKVRTRLGNPYLVVRAIIEGEVRRHNIPPQDLDVKAALVTGAIIQMIDTHIFGSLKGPLAPHADAVADGCVALLEV